MVTRTNYHKVDCVEPLIKGLDAEPVGFHGSMRQCTDDSYTITAYSLTDIINLLNGASFIVE